MTYAAAESRYETMPYRRAGRSGLLLPAVSLGLWHNLGGVDQPDNGRQMLLRAFDLGITHFDLANNYGPPAGSAESTFGRVLQSDLRPYRDQLVISTKAGYRMWPGPYGDLGSRKYLVSSLDQSLRRLGLDCVDIFFITTASIPRRRSLNQWARWRTSCARERRFTSVSQTIRRRWPSKPPSCCARRARRA
jgi:L-glyceraldehyde 3-phosphate reductase